MDGRIRHIVPYWIVTAFALYVFPLFIRDTGTAIFILFVVFPVSLFGISLVYAVRHWPLWGYVASVPVLFVPTVFVYYGSDLSALLLYGTGYTVIALMAYWIGRFLHRK